jgi:adenosylhomocysteine nucleosidase
MEFALKTIADKTILYCMAVDAEYGDHLQALIKPLMTGVGPIEAGVVVSSTLTRLELANEKPDFLVSLGSAGSPSLEQTHVYQASSISYRDMDASALGFEKGATPFLDLPTTVPLSVQIPGVETARLSTGANVVSGVAYDAIDADMVDMESFAVMRACMMHDVEFIGLRGISDGKDELKHVDDWTEYLHIVDENLAKAVGQLEDALDKGALML